MPKFLTYQRPAAVSRQKWNPDLVRKTNTPRQAPEPMKPVDLPALKPPSRKS